MEHELDLIEAVEDLIDAALELIELDAPTLHGLKHAKHASKLLPIRAKATAILRKFFKRQGAKLLKQIRPQLKTIRESALQASIQLGNSMRPGSREQGYADRLREAEADGKEKAAQVIPDALPLSISGGMGFDYAGALSSALSAGYTGLASEAGYDSELAEDTVQTYLKDHSLTKLSGGLDETTVQRLRNALADAYDSGADYEGLVQAVQDEYAGFGSVRAGMIAQTEMNTAYNAGRKQLGLDVGFNEKAWNPDGTACEEICVPNVLQGWIPIDEDFESGDDAPAGHPSCDCTLDVRFNADALSESLRVREGQIREGWVTIDGAHVFIGDDGTITKGPPGLIGKAPGGGKSEVSTPSKSEIAKASQNVARKAEQHIAEQTEVELSAALKMPKSPDNNPFDLQSKTVGIEVKTLISNTNDKITMSKSAVLKKHAEVERAGLKKTYTIVADKRGAATSYFIREGFGSFRIGAMTAVPDTAGLLKFMG